MGREGACGAEGGCSGPAWVLLQTPPTLVPHQNAWGLLDLEPGNPPTQLGPEAIGGLGAGGGQVLCSSEVLQPLSLTPTRALPRPRAGSSCGLAVSAALKALPLPSGHSGGERPAFRRSL